MKKAFTTKKTSRRRVYFSIATVLIIGACISAFLASLQRGNNEPSTALLDETKADHSTGTSDTLVLFYVAQDGLGLISQERKVPQLERQDNLSRARRVVEEQLGEAPEPFASPFPEGTRTRAIYLTPNGDAFVDLSLEVSRGHHGGALDELLTVYALVNALTTNVPDILAVQILVGGQEVDTLAGHVDLRRPLARNLKWVAGSASKESPEQQTNNIEAE